ncbi:MAG: hypothetical protein AABW65_01795 [Nanoarchaeota archaeon]
MTSLLARIKDRYYGNNVINLIKTGRFDEAITLSQRLSSLLEQENALEMGCAIYCIIRLLPEEIHFFDDFVEYERVRAIGGNTRSKRILYVNPKTDNIERGIDELIQEFMGESNPVIIYMNYLRAKRSEA